MHLALSLQVLTDNRYKMIEISKKTRNRIISALATIILVAAICFCLFVVTQLMGKGYVSLGGYSFFKVVTPSMEPTLMVDEIIITKAVPMEQVNQGDIISFRSQSVDMFGKIITHRVVEIQEDKSGEKRFLTKGDANLSADGTKVVESNFVGKVIWSSGDSAIAEVISFISGKYGFVSCIVLPSFIFFIIILSSSVKNIRKSMDELVESLDKKEQTSDAEISKEEYDEMCKKIREELIEELSISENTQENKTE